jgi:hypothetical protein
MKKMFKTIRNKFIGTLCKLKTAVSNESGSGYIDQAITILIAVVVGALLLAGLYALFGDVVMPTLTQRIKEMFNYAG